MRYEGDIYRPPNEWRSYLLQATVGCSHNKCTFCGMYRNKRFYIRELEEVLEDIDMAREVQRDVDKVFLCDGDAIELPTDSLLAILEKLYATFPKLVRVSTYAGPNSTLRKSPQELARVRQAGLQRVYLGIESGDGELLIRRGKGVDAQGMLDAGLRLRQAGFDVWGMVMVGLAGGGDAYIRNATLTAQLANRMNPHHLSVLTYTPVPGTPMFKEIQSGKFVEQTPRESLLETRLLVEGIELEGLHFTSNHVSNYVPIKGTLRRDKQKLLELLDQALQVSDDALLRQSAHGSL